MDPQATWLDWAADLVGHAALATVVGDDGSLADDRESDTARLVMESVESWMRELVPGALFPEGSPEASCLASARESLEPAFTLLEAYQAVGRDFIQVVRRRDENGGPSLTRSALTDRLMSGFVANLCNNNTTVTWLLARGFPVQASTIVRQSLEVAMRAVVLADNPALFDEWWLAGEGEFGSEWDEATQETVRKRLWYEAFRPAKLIEAVARIETEGSGEAAEGAVGTDISQFYTWLSTLAHADDRAVFLSLMPIAERGLESDEDTLMHSHPFAGLWKPTVDALVGVGNLVVLNRWFWRLFPLVAIRHPSSDGVRFFPNDVDGGDDKEFALLMTMAGLTKAVDLDVLASGLLLDSDDA